MREALFAEGSKAVIWEIDLMPPSPEATAEELEAHRRVTLGVVLLDAAAADPLDANESSDADKTVKLSPAVIAARTVEKLILL